MSCFTIGKSRSLMIHCDLLGEIFHLAEEYDFLSKFLSKEEYLTCFNAGQSNYDRVTELIAIICTKKDNSFYIALLNRLIYLVKRGKKMIQFMKQMCENIEEVNVEDDEEKEKEEKFNVSQVNQVQWEIKNALHDMTLLCTEQEKLLNLPTSTSMDHFIQQLKEETIIQNAFENETKHVALVQRITQLQQQLDETSTKNKAIQKTLRNSQDEVKRLNKIQVFERETLSESTENSMNFVEIAFGEDVLTSQCFSTPKVADKVPPIFSMKRTKKMSSILATYQDRYGRPLLTCDTYGNYDIWKWMDDSSYDALDTWKKICFKHKGLVLKFPNMLLPTEFGGYIMQLYIQWDKSLNLYGWIPPIGENNSYNSSCPDFIELQLEVNLFINEKTFLSAIEKVRINKFGYFKLMKICDDVQPDWNLPQGQIKISKNI